MTLRDLAAWQAITDPAEWIAKKKEVLDRVETQQNMIRYLAMYPLSERERYPLSEREADLLHKLEEANDQLARAMTLVRSKRK